MARLILAIIALLGLFAHAWADAPPNPIANPEAVVTVGHARFTVLTPAMIRLEWSATDQFEDRASFAFVNRRLEVPEVTTSRDGDWTVIKTRELTLRYRADGGRFAKDNLSIELTCAGKPVKWVPGMADTGNLRGTTRTLDGVSGSCELEPGLLSRDGWVVVDDSKRLLFDSAPSPPHAGGRRGDHAVTVGMAHKLTGKSPNEGGMAAAVGGHVAAASAPGESHARSTAAGMPPNFESQPWVATRKDPDAIDWYFFGYGHDYKRALFDFTRVGGKIPLPPRYVFGAWWSRYWAYSDAELRQLVKEFDEHDVPLDVLVVDMDWHLDGWTGYTWNPKYFPDPKGFLDWAHEKGLKVTLNLHPADGVGKHEAAFPEFAKAMGLDPAKTDRIPFDCTDRKYMDAYFKLLHHPLEKMGIDFWWLDWQQGTDTKIAGLDPLFWLNHLHWTDMARNPDRTCPTAVSAVQSTSKPTSASVMEGPVAGASGSDRDARLRPLIFSRWGGLGNHRYPIGFSGDTYNNWESLAFQPYFTATAGNVGYAYWSHDIGGHQPGRVDPELYVRWIQWGALSPILRTHTTKNPDAERRIWAFPEEYFFAAREAYRLRYQLLPYIYTMARKTYDTGQPLCRPLYYEWPELDEAYARTGQYMFGDDLMVAPVTEPGDSMTGCANVEVWIPPGKWTNWFTGRTYEGPKMARLLVPLEDIPLFVRDGAVIPMAQLSRRSFDSISANVELTSWAADSANVRVYVDNGLDESYLSNKNGVIPKSVRRNRSPPIRRIRSFSEFADRPARDIIRELGIYHRFLSSLSIVKGPTVEITVVVAATIPINDGSEVLGEITFDVGPGVTNYDKPRRFSGLTENKPVIIKTAITSDGHVDSMRLAANVKLTKGEVSVEFPLQQTLFPSINHWWVIGPFEATFEKGLAKEYPPEGEKAFDATAKYDGKGGKKIEWKRVSRTIRVGDDPTKEHFVDLNKLYDSPGNAVAYGMTFLNAPSDMDATLAIGSDDGAAMWLNGAEIYRQDVGRAYTSKQDRVPVKLKKGLNPLLIKIKQGTGGWGFCVHVENKKGEPLPEVKAVLER